MSAGSMEAVSALDLNWMIADLGPLVEALEILTDGEGRWTIALLEDLVITLEEDEAARKLFMSVDVGRPPLGQELAAYQLLLQISAMTTDTGGLRFGMNPQDEMLIQIYDLPLAELDLDTLRAATAHFAATALDARTLLAEMRTGAGESVSDEATLLRV